MIQRWMDEKNYRRKKRVKRGLASLLAGLLVAGCAAVPIHSEESAAERPAGGGNNLPRGS